jgi:putative RNA 2'-phosphotransferase
MTDKLLNDLSKYLSFILRHQPQSIGLTLDEKGWANTEDLIEKATANGKVFNYETLLRVVETNKKKRFTLSDDGRKIRAAQGHSIDINLGLEPKEPPAVLYHGTATRFLDSILKVGLQPQSRQQVHLSTTEETARNVGQRHGKAVVLKIEALLMYQQGFKFFKADNGVWLTDHVPPEFLASLSSNVIESAITSRQPKLST